MSFIGHKLSVSALFVLLLVGCASRGGKNEAENKNSKQQKTVEMKTSLQGAWQFYSFGEDQEMEVRGERATLDVDAEKNAISGTDGCNRYRAMVLDLSDRLISFDQFLTTRMMCDNTDFVVSFHTALRSVKSYNIEGKKLFLYDASKKCVIIFFSKVDTDK